MCDEMSSSQSSPFVYTSAIEKIVEAKEEEAEIKIKEPPPFPVSAKRQCSQRYPC